MANTVAPLTSLKKVKLYASISLCKSAPLASKEFAEKKSKVVKIISTLKIQPQKQLQQ